MQRANIFSLTNVDDFFTQNLGFMAYVDPDRRKDLMEELEYVIEYFYDQL